MSSQAVILIPGIKGTKLVNTVAPSFDVIWSGFQSEFETIEDLELTSAHRGAHYDEAPETIIKPGELESLAYGEFVRDLKVGKPIYVFSYDWRMSAVENGRKLGAFVDYLVAKSNASSRMKPIKKVDFVTHSLGNLILRCYLKETGLARMNKIVFTVPPFAGSLDIVVTTLAGEGFFPSTRAKIRKLIRTYPGAMELLPTYDDAGFFAGPDGGVGPLVDFFAPDDWQENITKTDHPAARRDKNELAKKFAAALTTASVAVHQKALDLSELSDEERGRILVIARTGYTTLQSLSVHRTKRNQPNNFFDLSRALRTDHGDSRVPDVSSCLYHDTVLTLMITDHWFHFEHSHGFILNDERVQRLVGRFLGDAPFEYGIAGNSVRRVTAVKKGKKKQGKTKYPYWKAVLKS